MKERILYGTGAVTLLSLLPVVLFRWRIVVERDDLLLVFLRVRRVSLKEVVEAKSVAREGLVFVCRDGSEHSFGGLGNSAWAHRRKWPTHTDLVARDVLQAAAGARGEEGPLDYRLPPVRGLMAAAMQWSVGAAIVGFFLRD
ncbi:hypothetical protein [Nocardioides sp. WS12]|uniref:hypothetical protein n=1 Tax=Nocardioides sp. WS12 TaxID=2486272 RepID=UPI0015F87055|nr:hypothetical protein [Nocardioides sp. WS12]